MGKTVAELQEEAKKKIQDQKIQDQKNQPDSQKELEEAKSQIAFLTAQATALQGQLDKSSSSEEEARLAQEAENLKKQEEALKQEANIAQILDDALKTEPGRVAEAGDNELSQKELAGVIAETVGKALDASSKLTMGEMDKKLAESNKQITGLQTAVIELLGSMSVENARKKHDDFDKYAEGAREVHSSHPSLSPEEAYLLHKAKEASKQPDKDKIETERPSEPPQWTPDRPFSTSRESTVSAEEHLPDGNPRQKFRHELSSAVDSYLARRGK
jgi:hypothetical protein